MERREGRCYRPGALESRKAEGFGDGFGREVDAWQGNDWREGEHGSIELSGGGWILGNIQMEKRRGKKGVAIGVEHWRAGRLRPLGAGLVGS